MSNEAGVHEKLLIASSVLDIKAPGAKQFKASSLLPNPFRNYNFFISKKPMADSQPDSNFFSVRIVSIDHYMAPPIPGYDICYSSFQGGKVNEVPVIRVYGSTPAGQKTCLHIHRALPYLYVPCADIPLQPHQEDDCYTHAISLALEQGLKVRGSSSSKRQHVHECKLVRAKRFYGYHSSEDLFVKIYLYYPHDVSRAAELLLGGAVLNKSLQPHESHIPFLLQFLVDYNLYGMGHLHLSKLKFRHPVPNVFSPRKFNYNNEHASADFQADSSGTACLISPIWVSSTIPGDWMWQFSSEFDGPSGQNVLWIKRQSVSELEGDAAVDDILNQQFIMYTSLSQTCADVKMVQSLMPIWEEEYQRTGMHGAAMAPDPGKSLPQDVLRTLSLGLEFENVLAEMCGEGLETIPSFENNGEFVKSGARFVNVEDLVKLGHSNYDYKDQEHLTCLKDKKILSSLSPQALPHQEEMSSMPSKGKDAYPELLSSGEIQSSEMIVSLSQKATDTEALGLLKWLATSQAAEDLNSDDELLHETILSPLMPETTIDKVLEKANMDYERESQKECQDILDSIEDVINVSSVNPQTSSLKKIPQVDGSSDDLYLLPCAGSSENLSKTEMNSESKRSFQHQVPQDIVTNVASKPNVNKTLWSSLPFCVAQQVNKDLQTVSYNITDTCVSEVKDHRAKTYLIGNEQGKCSDATKNEDSNAHGIKAALAVTGGSVRDLMRRKRCYRESPECGPLRAKRVFLTGEQKNDLSLCQKQLDFDTWRNYEHEKCPSQGGTSISLVSKGKMELPWPFNTNKEDDSISGGDFKADNVKESDFGATSTEVINCNVYTSESEALLDVQLLKMDKPKVGERLQQTENAGSSCFSMSSSPVEHELFSLDGLISKYSHEHRISLERVHDISNKKFVDTVRTNDATALQNEVRTGGELGQDSSGLPGFGCLESINVNVEAKPVDLIGMTFCMKPPITDCKDGAFDNAFCSSTITDRPYLVDKENREGISGAFDEILPFFLRDCLEDKELQSKLLSNNYSNFNQEHVVGVPTQYLNDGSCLYMLTPAFSPPSVDSVHRWLLHDNEGTFGDIDKTSSEHSSLEGSDLRAVLEEVHQEADEVQSGEINPDSNGVTAILQSEGHTAEVNACADCLQDISQISGPDGRSRLTPLSQIGFRDPASVGAGGQLTLLSIEVQAESRGDLRPDPRYDAINVVALAFQNDNDYAVEVYVLLHSKSESGQRSHDGIPDCKVFVCSEEKHLFSHFIKILCSFDPDILMGWDIQGGSLGFLAERAAHLGIGLLNDISRTPFETKMAAGDLEISARGMLDNMLPEPLVPDSVLAKDAIIEDEWGRTHASGVHVGGRIVLNVWRLMRGEVKLNMYTVEAVADAVMRRKTPSIPYKVLTKWFSSGPGRARYRCVEYVVGRAKLNLEIMNQLDMINRTSELARVFGIDFFSVLSRGSQYRVESMFLRLAHTQNYLAISPGNHQVASQPAMECLPLVMEPESGFYADPVVVLDFQSLYPSMIIAYNLCFCTCLGKVLPSKENTLGVSSFRPDLHVLQDLKDQILLTPNGVMYVPPKVRKGVLPRLLEEILSTRIMVKQALKKLVPSQQIIHRIFNARQLALKLIANVTYGYTAAGFSGRMPCAELADSIVQCGRSTLERAISFVNATEKWKAKVIYGDTDSMFVLLKGRTVEESFQIGQEIASAVTAMNPNPVTLKMEKVYHPCFLLTKKRYVGYSYESPDQIQPTFDAKGIETVRRDTCAAVAKMMEQSLRLFFEHQDISEAKAYLQRQWTRILSGRVSLQDFVFAKEVRLGTYSTRSSSSLPPAAIVATKAMRADPRAEPRYAERVPYVVVHGEPGARLVDLVVDPLDLLALDSPYRLNDLYYINKQIIPALQRVFGLVGADLNHWFLEMPRPSRESFAKRPYASNPRRSRIDFYYLSKHCVLCGELVQASAHLCNKCSRNEVTAATAVIGRTSKLERGMQHLTAICRHCGGGDWILESGVKCTSLACSVFYERRKDQKELQGLSAIAADKDYYPKCIVEWF